ncbi:hypothetical protein Kpol_1041p10 [Vanderwaltozyma polyspora DSM 70294]|uniref:NAD-specific glutamate dehydrogenase n=1 Tax=Vanderwaltozyma polyspora (strain ATCC 22028 / DSM 70294 / BCRC 21397 / CBS 2163 / NBRC 10782 / NRRL Y-8283 / UCD 57-17) TaxID=436907 RepID=A7TL77_VANPO|nr:uncharacterized protein Kpol_1041p10 [Vanderwaltozyma polyspora DSM 70294]EDO16952.1 hypothetical protein Kpol_1041p10 [Vanderwaltozyma polyspora DSM 70294]
MLLVNNKPLKQGSTPNTASISTPSNAPPDISALSISSMSDYHVFDFPGKDLQREQIIDLLDQQGFIPDDLIEQEVDWFYNSLGIDDLFFSKESPDVLANIINSLYASKLDAFAKSKFSQLQLNTGFNNVNNNANASNQIDSTLINDEIVQEAEPPHGNVKLPHSHPQSFNIRNKIITNNHAILIETNNICPTRLSSSSSASLAADFERDSINNEHFLDCSSPYQLDSVIDDLFLDNKSRKSSRCVSYWTQESGLKLSFIYESVFDDNISKQIPPAKLLNGEIDGISDKIMLQVTSPENKRLYGLLIKLVQEREGPIIKTVHSIENNDEIRLLVAFKRFTTKKYYSALTSLFHYYKLNPSKFYLESFKQSDSINDDIIIFSIYLNKTLQSDDILPNDLELSIRQIEKEASLLYAIPDNSFRRVYEDRQFSPQEAVYAHVGSIFINHFINRLGANYQALISQLNLNESNTLLLEIVDNLKKKLRSETFTKQMIIANLEKYHKIVSKLYKNFAELHHYQDNAKKLENTLSYQRFSKLEPFANDQEFESYLNKFIPNDSPALLILKTLNLFNKSILKTNFFVTRKVAISFRLNPELIMPKSEYPETPFGIFYVIGNTFTAFHIRFREIARGGIRIVVSRTLDAYEVNSRSIIDENYQLASTQQRKNKDIPEGGSKGVILLNHGLTTQDHTFIAFSQYVDAMIDILIKDPLKEKYIDLLGHEEILFFGPDEGSAGFVNWATEHARKRGCPWWKSFLTGKSPKLGGIPHDEYGMTSLGVRAYVNEIYKTLELTDKKIFKFQTGGPDGDLGSNEILLSTPNEVYVGLLDGSGVLCDPNGLDKLELVKLAHERKMVSNYDKAKLSELGFLVTIDDMDVMLPNGTIVANGTTFRNTFHTEVFKFVNRVDLFVPCGGRPSSINLNNLSSFIDERTNKSKIPYIVEGANLFIAKSASVALEKHGCILFKDMSVNKGGVTSSSLEVLASLSLNDNDFVNKFIGHSTDRTQLYKDYVVEVQKRIMENAELEFHQLWNLRNSTNSPTTKLSITLSQTINKLNDDLIDSNELWNNDLVLRDYLLLNKIIPKLLIDIAGPENILENIPVPYLKALISSYLSSSFVYKFGIDVDIGKFLEYIGDLKREAYASS